MRPDYNQSRPGFYVRGRWYGLRLSQALARARWLAAEHRTAVDVWHVFDGNVERFRTVQAYTGSVLNQHGDKVAA
jgi:hypothetical protein